MEVVEDMGHFLLIRKICSYYPTKLHKLFTSS